jgi:hypothetical protein
MKRILGLFPGLSLLLLGLFWGCDRRPEGWTPVLEETSTAFLETETERALDRVRTAQEHIGDDPAAATSALEHAESALEHLTYYYLPLFQARERAYNAYRSFYLSDEDQAIRELERIEGILDAMAKNAPVGQLQELQSLGEVLADARLAVEAGGDAGAPALEVLARRLNQVALKGDLILER